MGIKHQKGVALVVALMLTIIIGVIAITLGSISNKTQRSDNANYSKVVSTSNSVSGVNRGINFLVNTTNFKNKTFLDPSYQVPGSGTISIYSPKGELSTVDVKKLAPIFKGIRPVIGDKLVNGANATPWYRQENAWVMDQQFCGGKCVSLNDGTTTYLIEYRGFQPDSPNSQSLAAKIGYSFYRITSRGLDRPNTDGQLPSSATIVQTNVGIRRSIE